MRSSRDSFLVDEGTGHDSARGCIDDAAGGGREDSVDVEDSA
jgi:hypothetical protein